MVLILILFGNGNGFYVDDTVIELKGGKTLKITLCHTFSNLGYLIFLFSNRDEWGDARLLHFVPLFRLFKKNRIKSINFVITVSTLLLCHHSLFQHLPTRWRLLVSSVQRI